jgi:hypothetical protein
MKGWLRRLWSKSINGHSKRALHALPPYVPEPQQTLSTTFYFKNIACFWKNLSIGQLSKNILLLDKRPEDVIATFVYQEKEGFIEFTLN